MKIVASIEARTGSSRLPGKVLLDLNGRPVLEQIIRRVRRCHTIDTIVVATSVNPADEAICGLCARLDIPFFRGSEDDVLGRLAECHAEMKSDIVVELTGDSPLADPGVIDRAVEMFRQNRPDYLSNTISRSFPIGLRVQVMKAETLFQAARLAIKPDDREHVTTYICRHPEKFILLNMEAPKDEHWPELRLTLDYAEDLQVIRTIYQALGNDCALTQVINFMRQHPETVAINQNCQHLARYV